jgi:dTDP-4-dehydrorhamnose reductase
VSRAELGALVALRYGLDPATVRTATLAGSGLVRPGEVRLDVSRATGLLRTRLRPVDEVL